MGFWFVVKARFTRTHHGISRTSQPLHNLCSLADHGTDRGEPIAVPRILVRFRGRHKLRYPCSRETDFFESQTEEASEGSQTSGDSSGTRYYEDSVRRVSYPPKDG